MKTLLFLLIMVGIILLQFILGVGENNAVTGSWIR